MVKINKLAAAVVGAVAMVAGLAGPAMAEKVWIPRSAPWQMAGAGIDPRCMNVNAENWMLNGSTTLQLAVEKDAFCKRTYGSGRIKEFIIISQPKNGKINIDFNNGKIVVNYVPNAGFEGKDTFSFKVSGKIARA